MLLLLQLLALLLLLLLVKLLLQLLLLPLGQAGPLDGRLGDRRLHAHFLDACQLAVVDCSA